MKCPGIDSRHLRAITIKCEKCGYKVEVFSDEMKTRCPKCRKDVHRKNLPSCLDWCKYAETCLPGASKKKKGRKK